MNKIFPLLAGLALTSQAGADRVAENLRGLRIADMCPINVMFYVSTTKMTTIEDRIESVIKRQDDLFGLGFMNVANLPSCSQGMYMSVEAIPGPSDTYVYIYNFAVFASNATIKSGNNNLPVRLATFYDQGGFGFVPNLTRLEEVMTENAIKLFQDFVLDWRKTH